MKAIVSLANSSGNYLKGLDRLKRSLTHKFYGNFFGFIGENTVGAPLHKENPYAFKIYAIERAVALGYQQVLWLDSSCYAVNSLAPIFNLIEQDGYFMQEAGNWVGNWCNDRTLEYFGLTREQAMSIPMFSAGMTGLNFDNEEAREFFAGWKRAMLDGQFKGEWTDHRHDMSCASIIAHRSNFQYQRDDQYVQYGAPDGTTINDSICIKLQGL